MNPKRSEKTCCLDETEGRPPFHLCCPDCRKELAQEERARLMDAGTAPDGCSPEIIPAPARGALAPFREGYWHEEDGQGEWRHVPYRSGCPGQTRDIFDTMTDQATRRGGDAPFTAAQVGAARDYRALHERVRSAGVKCSRAFDVQAGGQGRVDFMDAYIRDTERLGMFTTAIGTGHAMAVRVCGAHSMGRGSRWSVTDARLVEMVCIGQKPLSAVLEAHGWPVTGKNRKTLRDALCVALGRMQGL